MLELTSMVLPMVEAGALILARPLGFIIVFPVFGWLGLRGVIRSVVAFVIGIPLLQIVYSDLLAYTTPLPVEYVGILAVKGFFVGIVLAVVLGTPFWAAEVAGNYVDVYRGSSMATVVSPDQISEPLITGVIFTIALVAIFIVSGGMHIAIDAIYQSYQIWPMLEVIPQISQPLYPFVVDILSKIFKLGLALGAPIMIPMFLGELALAYSSRFAQQINVFDATLSVKNLIFLFILPPYLYMLISFYGAAVLDIEGVLEIVARMVVR